MRFGPDSDGTRPWGTVVGVVGDVKQQSLASQNTAAFYVPIAQWRWIDPVQSLVVRTSGDASALTNSVKRAVWSVDRNKPITRVATMEQLILANRIRPAIRLGDLRYVRHCRVAARRCRSLWSDLGTRGRTHTRVRHPLRAWRDAAAKSCGASWRTGFSSRRSESRLGMAGASATSRLLETLLYGISRADPATYVGVIALLGCVAALACWAPARRAAAVDPAVTLRSE